MFTKNASPKNDQDTDHTGPLPTVELEGISSYNDIFSIRPSQYSAVALLIEDRPILHQDTYWKWHIDWWGNITGYYVFPNIERTTEDEFTIDHGAHLTEPEELPIVLIENTSQQNLNLLCLNLPDGQDLPAIIADNLETPELLPTILLNTIKSLIDPKILVDHPQAPLFHQLLNDVGLYSASLWNTPTYIEVHCSRHPDAFLTVHAPDSTEHDPTYIPVPSATPILMAIIDHFAPSAEVIRLTGMRAYREPKRIKREHHPSTALDQAKTRARIIKNLQSLSLDRTSIIELLNYLSNAPHPREQDFSKK